MGTMDVRCITDRRMFVTLIYVGYDNEKMVRIFVLRVGQWFRKQEFSTGNRDTQADRLEALDSFCDCEKLRCCDLKGAAVATENFVIGDLKKLSQRIILEATARGAVCIEDDDIRRALQQSRPIGQRVEKFGDSLKLSWADVGGMQEVKKLLTEVFIWPTKYPSLFRSCVIRPGRGVLLHGPSGTGKTLIAKALASECQFSVITIKGPELLSKYIGQSEESVRNTFERARASKPCLIFFDEFDSLGAKRGHDNTGVTDRVVNQLLTEMDGVEELEGVFVLGATNRIDLIDNALLRPGRFDYIVECKLPNLVRLFVFKKNALSQKCHMRLIDLCAL
ncbi:unnamed protein product [Toxocara canis]|uniref:AAA domain-containing protein n=1 Tax=Toxocara canis TaxID=6265 RepID=A0A183V052_TOXCA|nr:unnamed protein product [Toxocara canis]